MSDRFKDALDYFVGGNWTDDQEQIIIEALTLATEAEQLRKERDELAKAVLEASDRFMFASDKIMFKKDFAGQINLAKKVSEENGNA